MSNKELIEEARRLENDFGDSYEVMVHMSALADALEAATRQPTEGDQEATEAEIDKAARVLHTAKCCSLSGDSPHDFPEASEVFAAGVVLNAVPRAAVPDAATAESERRAWAIAGHLERDREAVKAERDTALEAIDRVREAVEKHKHWNDDCGWDVPTIEVLAALDGAPEPDREYHLTGVETKREMTNPVYVLRGGVYLLDEHAGVLIDSAGNFSAKTKGNPRSLAVLLKAIAGAIEDDVEMVPVKGEADGA